MQTLSQSSRHSLSPLEAQKLLRYAPHLVVAQGGPVFHYHFPLGLWDGAPVHYALQSGMILQQWRGVLVKREENRLEISLMPAFAGPWESFRAIHTFSEDAEGVIIEDELSFLAPGSPVESLLARSICAYRFDARRWVSRMDSEAQTTNIRTVRDSQTAG